MNNDRQELVAKAKQLGLEFPNNIKTDKLKEMIDGVSTVEVQADVLKSLQSQIDQLRREKLVSTTVKDTPSDNKEAKIKRALTLIRCTVIPRDPSKINHKADIITMSNDLIGDLRYKIPFNVETHIPFAIYKILEAKKVNIYDDSLLTGNKETGQIKGGYKTIDAYSINVLPKLTEAELKALARKQRLRSDNLDDREDAILEEEEEETDTLTAMGYDL